MDVAPITYVRHAMPAPEPARHPTEWSLEDGARAEVSALAARLEVAPEIGALVTSTEPKAVETAEVIGAHWGVPVRMDDRLREAIRPWIGAGYRGVVHRYLRGERPEGWEAHEEVAARVAAARRDALDTAAGRPVVVVSHGLALTLHLGEILGRAFDRESFWSGLTFPDAWSLDEAGTLHRPRVRSDLP